MARQWRAGRGRGRAVNMKDRRALRRLNRQGVRAYTVSEDHLSRLIGLAAEGFAEVYEIDGAIWFRITAKGQRTIGGGNALEG